jgi:hypothetical protein
MMMSWGLLSERLSRAKFAYTTRHVRYQALHTLLDGDRTPAIGDLVLARVERIGHHKGLERTDGRKAHLFPGDEIVVVYGNRYAPDQFEAEVPGDLGPCHLAAAGGIAARVASAHSSTGRPTAIAPVGLLGDAAGRPVNIAHWALGPPPPLDHRPLTLAVVGTTMNSGKTTAAAHLVVGLVRSGLRVGATKVTGTGAGGDIWLLTDAGASPVLDFTHAGLPSTYGVGPEAVERAMAVLTGHVAAAGVDVVIVEVADGLFHQGTGALLRSRTFAATVDGLLFAARDAAGASAGVQWLRREGLPVVAVSGSLTASKLAVEEAEMMLEVPVLGTAHLRDPAAARSLLEAAVPVLAA